MEPCHNLRCKLLNPKPRLTNSFGLPTALHYSGEMCRLSLRQGTVSLKSPQDGSISTSDVAPHNGSWTPIAIICGCFSSTNKRLRLPLPQEGLHSCIKIELQAL